LTAISSKQQTAQKERTHWHVYLMIRYIYYYLIVHIYICGSYLTEFTIYSNSTYVDLTCVYMYYSFIYIIIYIFYYILYYILY
jgi:hypothetical protein